MGTALGRDCARAEGGAGRVAGERVRRLRQCRSRTGAIAGDPWASAGVPGAEVRARRRLAGLVWARVEDGVPIGLVLKEGCGPQLAGR